VLLIAILHFIPDKDDPWDIVRRLIAVLPAGSYLVVSHATPENLADAVGKDKLNAVYAETASGGVAPGRSPRSAVSLTGWNWPPRAWSISRHGGRPCKGMRILQTGRSSTGASRGKPDKPSAPAVAATTLTGTRESHHRTEREPLPISSVATVPEPGADLVPAAGGGQLDLNPASAAVYLGRLVSGRRLRIGARTSQMAVAQAEHAVSPSGSSTGWRQPERGTQTITQDDAVRH
jgi:hypothetical protein